MTTRRYPAKAKRASGKGGGKKRPAASRKKKGSARRKTAREVRLEREIAVLRVRAKKDRARAKKDRARARELAREKKNQRRREERSRKHEKGHVELDKFRRPILVSNVPQFPPDMIEWKRKGPPKKVPKRPRIKKITYQKRTWLIIKATDEKRTEEERRAAVDELLKSHPDIALSLLRELIAPNSGAGHIPGRHSEVQQHNFIELQAAMDSVDYKEFEIEALRHGWPVSRARNKWFSPIG